MRYQWRKGWEPGGDPQTVGEILEQIREQNGGLLQPRHVVKAAAPANHPLHRYFEWDDRKAAAKWRHKQAQSLINHVYIEMPDDPEADATIAYVSIGEHKQDGRYFVSAQDAMVDPEMRQQVLGEAMQSIQAWRRRYQALTELSEIFQAIDAVNGAGV
jgi:hypothetical protein